MQTGRMLGCVLTIVCVGGRTSVWRFKFDWLWQAGNAVAFRAIKVANRQIRPGANRSIPNHNHLACGTNRWFELGNASGFQRWARFTFGWLQNCVDPSLAVWNSLRHRLVASEVSSRRCFIHLMFYTSDASCIW